MNKNKFVIPEETVKDLYNDGLKPTIQESGKALSIIPKIFNGMLAKVNMWCISKETEVEEFKIEMEKRLNQKREDVLVDPDPSIIIPCSEAAFYNLDKKEIKELYMNLMLSDMDINTKKYVHPSFTEVIKQLDVADVKIFTKIFNSELNPVCRIQHKIDKGFNVLLDFVLLDDYYELGLSTERVVKAINNLERLKLIDIPYSLSYVNESVYLNIENGNIVKEYKLKYQEQLEIKHMAINKTQFGKEFFDVCCK